MLALMMIIAGVIILGCYFIGIHYTRRDFAIRFFHTFISLTLITPFMVNLYIRGGIPC